MSVRRSAHKAFNIFEKINTIKRTCAAIDDDIKPDDISWTSSNEDLQNCMKTKTTLVDSVIDPREKVKNWIRNNSSIKKRVTNSKSATKKCKNRRITNSKNVSKLNVCGANLSEENDQKSESMSPIISKTQIGRINDEKIAGKFKEVPILRTPVKIKLENNNYESHGDSTHSPILGKKRKLIFEIEEMLPLESKDILPFESEKILPLENSSRETSPILFGQFRKKITCQKNSVTPKKTHYNVTENEDSNIKSHFPPKKLLNAIFENESPKAAIAMADNCNNKENVKTEHCDFPPTKYLNDIFDNVSSNITSVIPKNITDDVHKVNYCNENIKTHFPPKKLLNAIFDNELSQVSIKFSNSPIPDVAISKSQQSSDFCAKISYESSETKEEINENNSLGIISLLTTPPKVTQPTLTANKNDEITFDASRMNNDGCFDSTVKKKRKKLIRGGVASRLQKALKKQNSFLSHWRHQNYLAANTNFELPAIKEEIYVFKIFNVLEESGRFLIQCFKIDSLMIENVDCYVLFLNNYFVKKITLKIGGTVRLYQPFSLFQIKDCKNEVEYLICNVCNLEILS